MSPSPAAVPVDLDGEYCFTGKNKNGSCRGSGTVKKVKKAVKKLGKKVAKNTKRELRTIRRGFATARGVYRRNLDTVKAAGEWVGSAHGYLEACANGALIGAFAAAPAGGPVGSAVGASIGCVGFMGANAAFERNLR